MRLCAVSSAPPLLVGQRCPWMELSHTSPISAAEDETSGAGMTDSLGSLVENLRPHPSSLRKQVEARHKSAGEFSFYGPAGSDFGQSLCKPRTRDAGHFSPGPARYNYLHMTPELVRHPLASSSAAHASPAALVEETRAEPVLRPARDVERQAGAPRRRARVDARARARRAVGRPLPTSTGARRRAIAPPPRSRASTSTARSSRTGRARRTSTRPTSRASSPSSSIPGATSASRRRAAPRPGAPAGASPRRPRPQVAALLRPAAELVPVDDQGAAPAAQPKPAVSGGSARRAGARDAVVSGWLGEARASGSRCSGSSASPADSPGAFAGRLDRPAQSAFEAPVPHEDAVRLVVLNFLTSGD